MSQLGKGDAVIFSSRVIPGNELAICRAAEQAGGARASEVLTGAGSFRPCLRPSRRDELAQMYRWIRPQHRAAGAWRDAPPWPSMPGWRKSLQVPQALVPENGQMFRLAPGRAELIDEVPSGRVHLDGRVLVAEGEGLAKDRRAMAFAGLIVITLVLDGKGRIAAEPAVLIEGMPEPVEEAVRKAVEDLTRRAQARRSDELAENVRRAARRAARMPGARSRSPVLRWWRYEFPPHPRCLASPPGERDDPPPMRVRVRGRMSIGKLNHVAIATLDLDKATALYRDMLGAKVSAPVAQPEHGVTTVFVELPGSKIELLAPLGENSPIANFLKRNPEGGVHHLCFEVEDIHRGARPVAGAGRAGAGRRSKSARMASRCCSCIPRISAAC